MTSPAPAAPDGWVPTHPRQHPPFQPGHELSLQHGAFSPRKVDPLARAVLDVVLADAELEYLRAPRWSMALWAWARAEAQVQLLSEYIAKQGEVAGDGVGDLEQDRVRSAYLLLHRAETRATTGRTRLGLDPLSWAKLRKDGQVANALAANTAEIMARLGEMERRGVHVQPEPAELEAAGS